MLALGWTAATVVSGHLLIVVRRREAIVRMEITARGCSSLSREVAL